MNWNTFLSISCAILLISILFAVYVHKRKYRPGRVIAPFHCIFAGFFIASFVLLIPAYINSVDEKASAVLLALQNTFQIFTINADGSLITDQLINNGHMFYAGVMSALYVISPILTFGFALSFLKNVTAFFRLIAAYNKDIYIFSELNEKSLVLAQDLKEKHRNAAFVFTDVFHTNEEGPYELIEKARALKAILFKKDILVVDFKKHSDKKKMCFFTLGEDGTENINQSLKLIEKYGSIKKTYLYVFSTRAECEILLENAENGHMHVKRFNEVRSVINHLLDEQGYEKIFQPAVVKDNGLKEISAVVVGMGEHGTEMVKALSWYCQMTGYTVRINAFDIDSSALDKFSLICPDLISTERYENMLGEDALYDINIHSGVDVNTKTFEDYLKSIGSITYVFVALGNDEDNIAASILLRQILEKMSKRPVIQTIVYDPGENAALKSIKNFKNQNYNIDFLGDLSSTYSEKIVIDAEIDEIALERHLYWKKVSEDYKKADEKEQRKIREKETANFWKYEYNYQSSVAGAIHQRLRVKFNVPGAQEQYDDRTDEEKEINQKIEKRRWNAWMRADGYTWSGKTDRSTRNDLAKVHNLLVTWLELSEKCPQELPKDW